MGADTSTRLGQVLTAEELNQIRSDLSDISVKSRKRFSWKTQGRPMEDIGHNPPSTFADPTALGVVINASSYVMERPIAMTIWHLKSWNWLLVLTKSRLWIMGDLVHWTFPSSIFVPHLIYLLRLNYNFILVSSTQCLAWIWAQCRRMDIRMWSLVRNTSQEHSPIKSISSQWYRLV